MASKNTMSIHTFLEVAPRLPNNISVLLRGKHGIGKSQLVAQIAKQLDKELIDRRLSQMSEGDMIGLPSTDGNVTRFNPPDWFKHACETACVLFLDEFNRALPEVMQAAFQIVLDRELNGHKLHKDTRVFSAINMGAEYSVNEIDPALLRRFWVIDLEPSTEDWTTWARGRLDDVVVDFIAQDEKWLDPPKGNVDMNQVHTTRHSWERLDGALKHFNKEINGSSPEFDASEILSADHPLFYPVCIGFIGIEATTAFRDYAKTVDRRVSGEDILNKYPKVRDKVMRLGQEKWNICIEKLAIEIDKCTKITAAQSKNVEAFMKDLPGELRIALWAKLTAKGITKLDQAKSVWKNCMPLILDVFGVKPGEEGVGMIPNLPGLNIPGSSGEKK